VLLLTALVALVGEISTPQGVAEVCTEEPIGESMQGI